MVGGAGARKQSPPSKTSNVLVSEGGDCLWQVPCGGGGKPRVVMVGDGKTTTLEHECTCTLMLEGVVAEGGGAVAVVTVVLLVGSGCRHPCPCWWCSGLLSMRHWQLLLLLSSVLRRVHIETCGCHCCQ